MEMIDAGRSMGTMEAKPSEPNKKYYPSISLPADALKGKDVGTTCRLEIIGKITAKRSDDNGNEITIEVRKVGYKSDAGKMSKDEYLKKNEDERAEYDKEQMNKDVKVEEDDASDE